MMRAAMAERSYAITRLYWQVCQGKYFIYKVGQYLMNCGLYYTPNLLTHGEVASNIFQDRSAPIGLCVMGATSLWQFDTVVLAYSLLLTRSKL